MKETATMYPCTVPDCKDKGCCFSCAHCEGWDSGIPTWFNIHCEKQTGVTLQLHSYPKKDGVYMMDKLSCSFWKRKYKQKQEGVE